MELKLMRHGERVHAEYAPLPGENEGLVGRSTDEDRPLGGGDGVVTRYKKETSAAHQVCALGWIKTVYINAIEYTGLVKELKGLAFFWAIFYGVGIASVSVGCGIFVMSFGDFKIFYFLIMGAVLAIASAAFGLYMLATMLRAELFRPRDLPIIFDRENGKVYRLMREEKSGFLGAFKPWPILACEYEWSLVDCEHQSETFTTGGSFHTNHFLMFLVRKSQDDPTIIDTFQIANANSLSNELVDSMWEHIRRFMEERGPHLPTPSEPLADPSTPMTWWESMGAVGPFGSNYFKYWRKTPVYSLFMHIIFPFSLPMFLIWGTGNYLSFRTATPISWPREVLAAVGPPLNQM